MPIPVKQEGWPQMYNPTCSTHMSLLHGGACTPELESLSPLFSGCHPTVPLRSGPTDLQQNRLQNCRLRSCCATSVNFLASMFQFLRHGTRTSDCFLKIGVTTLHSEGNFAFFLACCPGRYILEWTCPHTDTHAYLTRI